MAISAVSSVEANDFLSGTDTTTETIDIGTRTNGLLLVSLHLRNAGSTQAISSVTWNGTAMSVSQHSQTDSGFEYRVALAYLVNPSNGSNTLSVTLAGSYTGHVWMCASWYDGAHQTQGEVLLAAMTTGQGTTDPSIGSATPSEDNALVAAAYTSENNSALSVTSSWGTELQNEAVNGWSRGCGYVIQTTAAAVTAGWNGADAAWCGIMGFFKAASSGVSISPPAGSMSVAGVAASLALALAATVGSLSMTGAAPTVSVSGSASIEVPAGSLVATGAYPSVQFGGPEAGALAVTGVAPTLAVGQTIAVPVGGLSAAGTAPLLAFTIEPPAGSVAVTGLAPALAIGGTDTTIAPPAGSLSVTGAAPVASVAYLIEPPAGSVTVSGAAPSAVVAYLIEPPAGSLTVTGAVPSVVGSGAVTPDAGALAVTGSAPALAWTITPDAGGLTVIGSAPSTAPTIEVLVGALVLTGEAPTVLAPLAISVPVGALSMTGSAPTVVDTGAPTLELSDQADVVSLMPIRDAQRISPIRDTVAL